MLNLNRSIRSEGFLYILDTPNGKAIVFVEVMPPCSDAAVLSGICTFHM